MSKMSTLSFITAHQQQHYIGPSSSVVVHHLINTARRCGEALQLCLSLRPDENTNDIISNQLLPPKALNWSVAASAAAAISYADRGALGWLLYWHLVIAIICTIWVKTLAVEINRTTYQIQYIFSQTQEPPPL